MSGINLRDPNQPPAVGKGGMPWDDIYHNGPFDDGRTNDAYFFGKVYLSLSVIVAMVVIFLAKRLTRRKKKGSNH